MDQVYENLCAEGLRYCMKGFTLSGFYEHIPVLSSEGWELLRNFQYVISGNNVAVLCVQQWG